MEASDAFTDYSNSDISTPSESQSSEDEFSEEEEYYDEFFGHKEWYEEHEPEFNLPPPPPVVQPPTVTPTQPATVIQSPTQPATVIQSPTVIQPPGTTQQSATQKEQKSIKIPSALPEPTVLPPSIRIPQLITSEQKSHLLETLSTKSSGYLDIGYGPATLPVLASETKSTVIPENIINIPPKKSARVLKKPISSTQEIIPSVPIPNYPELIQHSANVGIEEKSTIYNPLEKEPGESQQLYERRLAIFDSLRKIGMDTQKADLYSHMKNDIDFYQVKYDTSTMQYVNSIMPG